MGRWKGAFAGMIAGAAAVWAMDNWGKLFSDKVMTTEAKMKAELQDEDEEDVEVGEGPMDYDDISLIGRQHKEGEGSTEALGRHVFRLLMGKNPRSKEMKEFLSYWVHWEYGITQGGVYGWLHDHKLFGVSSGVRWGFLLWLFGDELAVPLLGLQSGPRSVSMGTHLNRLGLHLIYGSVLGLLTPIIKKLMPLS